MTGVNMDAEQQAVSMFKQGYTVDEVAEKTGLSKAVLTAMEYDCISHRI